MKERGIALAAAVFALAVIGMLVAGAFFASVLEQRAGENGRRLHQAFSLAEAGIGWQVATWDAGRLNALRAYPAETFGVAERGLASGGYGGRVLRLNETLYLIDVTGQDSLSLTGGGGEGEGARQRIGLVTRVVPVTLDADAALAAAGGARLYGNVRVEGGDRAPPAWPACNPTDSAHAGIVASGPVAIGGGASVAGVPPVREDTAPRGTLRYDELAALATIRQSGGSFTTRPSIRGGVCDRDDPLNWGDGKAPEAPCGNHAPIVHIRGDATLHGGHGQGILLVDGDLRVEGRYEFFGVIIVRGQLRASGDAVEASFWGSVTARSVELDLIGERTGFAMNYSKCAIFNALSMTARPERLVSRGWSQLF